MPATWTTISTLRLVRGELEGTEPALVRVHSHGLTGDVFGSTACDAANLSRAPLPLAKEDRGVFLYLHHTGRGFSLDSPEEPGVLRKSLPQARQLDRGTGRQRMVQHESGIGAQILIDLASKTFACSPITRKNSLPSKATASASRPGPPAHRQPRPRIKPIGRE